MAVIKSKDPPEVILGSLPSNIFISDLHDSTEHTVISFASNTYKREAVERVEGKNGRASQ